MRRTVVWLAFATFVVSCLPAHAIVLRFTPKDGLVTKHNTTITGTTSMTMPGMEGGAMKMTMSGSVVTVEKVLSTTSDTATVETKITGGKMTMNMQGEKQAIDIPEGRIVAEMDDRGRMVKMIENDMNFGGGEMMGSPLDFNDFAEFSAAFPDGDLQVKDTWAGTMQLPLQEGVQLNISANSRLLELATFQGRKCAKIRSAFKGPVSLDMSEQGQQMHMTGSLTGEFVTYYDYVNSVYVSSDGTITMTMKMSMDDPEEGTVNMNMKMTMGLKTKLM
jgi:hypothetical protein